MNKKLLLLLGVLIGMMRGISQPWMDGFSDNKEPNFFDIQRAFESYWIDKPHERGTGYHVFKRWEWYWEPRVGLSGTFPKPGHDMKAYGAFMMRHHRRSGFEGNWQPLGPTTTQSGYDGLGRLNHIAFHPTDPNIFWVGSPSGGVWKTVDYGKTWTTGTDNNPVLGVTTILVHPNNPDTLYIATGDGNRGSLWGMTGTAVGDNKSIGVLKSTDGGNSWIPTGLSWVQENTFLIGKLIMNPVHPNILYAATSDGMYKTENSGEDWKRIGIGFYRDVALHPTNPDIIYGSRFNSEGGAGIMVSTDGGATFQQRFVDAVAVRIVLATTPLLPNVVHALISNRSGGLLGVYESTDSGNTFTRIMNTPNILANNRSGTGTTGQGWYDLTYTFSPVDPDITYAGGVNIWRSDNRGKKFTIKTMWTADGNANPGRIPVTHADKHFLIHHPLEPETLFDCNDGGIYLSKDRGDTWEDISSGLNITQFYRFDIHPTDTSVVLAGSQDNGALIAREGKWNSATGGDGMECAIDKDNPDRMYTTYAYGRMYLNINGFRNRSTITISNNIPGRPNGAWVTPYKLIPGKSGSIVAGYRDIYVSSNYGTSWIQKSNNIAGGQLLRNLAIAENNTQIWYTGDYYRVYRTFNGGDNWSLITSSATPISMIKTDPDNDSILFLTFSSYTDTLKVAKYDGTEAGNGQITNFTFNLPNISVNCIALHAGRKDAMYIGTDVGIFYRDKLTENWVPFANGLPNVVVTEIIPHNNYQLLYASTYGRGMWKSPMYADHSPLEITRLIPEHNRKMNPVNIHPEVHFNDLITRGTGNIHLYEIKGNEQELLETFDMRDTMISIQDHRLVIKPSSPLPYDALIQIVIEPDAVRKAGGTTFGGTKDDHWQFSTIQEIGDEDLLEERVRIYPNPTRDELTISCLSCEKPFDIILYNAYGKEVKNSQKANKSYTLDVNNLAQGTYHLRFGYGSKYVIKTIVVY